MSEKVISYEDLMDLKREPKLPSDYKTDITSLNDDIKSSFYLSHVNSVEFFLVKRFYKNRGSTDLEFHEFLFYVKVRLEDNGFEVKLNENDTNREKYSFTIKIDPSAIRDRQIDKVLNNNEDDEKSG